VSFNQTYLRCIPGGVKYDKTSVAQSVKGWSVEDIVRFNTLFDLVKRDRAENPDFERHWLEARRSAQEEGGAIPKKRKLQPPQARSELFESATATREPVEESDSATDDETD
jgi:hypothetical protein